MDHCFTITWLLKLAESLIFILKIFNHTQHFILRIQLVQLELTLYITVDELKHQSVVWINIINPALLKIGTL